MDLHSRTTTWLQLQRRTRGSCYITWQFSVLSISLRCSQLVVIFPQYFLSPRCKYVSFGSIRSAEKSVSSWSSVAARQWKEDVSMNSWCHVFITCLLSEWLRSRVRKGIVTVACSQSSRRSRSCTSCDGKAKSYNKVLCSCRTKYYQWPTILFFSQTPASSLE